jgi:hypothetical protein
VDANPLIYGDQTPAKSRTEMETLSALSNVSIERLPAGKYQSMKNFRNLSHPVGFIRHIDLLNMVMPDFRALRRYAGLLYG